MGLSSEGLLGVMHPGRAWPRVSTQQSCQCRLLAPLHLHPPPTCTFCSWPYRDLDFHWRLNRHWSRYFFIKKKKSKEQRLSSKTCVQILLNACQSHPRCAACDIQYWSGRRAWPWATSALVWDICSTGCVFIVPKLCMTCEHGLCWGKTRESDMRVQLMRLCSSHLLWAYIPATSSPAVWHSKGSKRIITSSETITQGELCYWNGTYYFECVISSIP